MATINAREESLGISTLGEGDELILKSVTCTHNHTRRHEYEEGGITTVGSYQEAIAGGVTTSFGMPNTKPAITTVALVDEFFEQGKDLPGYRYMHFGMRDDNMEACNEALAHPRVVSLKVYPAWRDESGEAEVVTTSFAGTKAEVFDHDPESGHTLDAAAQLCIQHNKPMIIHCETPNMGHTPVAEEHYIAHTVLPLCKRYPALKFVVAHTTLLSTAEAVIACNEEFGTNIYMELTPHHLRFTVDDIQDNFLECFPRLRSAADRDGLMVLLSQIGTNPACKFMHGTDHAPHTIEAKEQGSRGIPNFRDTLPLFLTLADRHGMTTKQLQQFFRGTAEECYPFLKEEEDMFTTLVKQSYTPEAYYYEGVVKNPFYGEEFEWKVMV